MATLTVCDICSQPIDPGERVDLQVNDHMRLSAISTAAARAALDRKKVRHGVAFEPYESLTLYANLHASCYRTHILPAITAALRDEESSS